MTRFPRNEIISLVGEAPRYDLAESVGPDLRLRELVDWSGEPGLGGIALGYRTAAGDPALRGRIAHAHGVNADDDVVTVGGMHALFLLSFILCERGNEAVTTAPLFPLARNSLECVGAQVRALPLSFDRAYQPDLEDLRALLSPRTKLVSVASPQNPSGVALRRETLREILSLVEVHAPDAWLLVDETYREAAVGNDPIAESAVTLGSRVISMASLSKCHGAPGLRLGWAITGDAALREELVLGKFNTVVSNSAIDEALALKVFENRERILGERRRHLSEGLRRTEAWVREHRSFVDWVRPDAGTMCCVRLKPSRFDDAAVMRFHACLKSEGVRVGDGTWFGDEARVFRLGFGALPMADLEAGLAALARALRQAEREAA
jgi:aspartate/methionine/tyrosine aminotransferase